MPFGTITNSAPTKAPPSADPLSAIAPLLRVRPEIQAICRFAARWESEHRAEPPGWAQFHIVTKGRCLLEQRDGTPLLLQAGQLLLLPHGDAHVVRSAERGERSGAPIRVEFNNAVRIKTNTDGESDTELICGRLKFHGAPDNLIIAALPPAILLRLEPGEPFHRMRMLVQAMDEELEAGRLGATAVAEDLARALFVMMLRGHFDQAACSSNLMKLLVTPPSARAVTAMLTAPAQSWTLDALAAEARVSRATLVRIFRQAAGLAPLAFLSELRLELARHRLASTKLSLAKLAADVGYESESSFARAFRRRFGVSPGRSRTAALDDVVNAPPATS
jgi:AraC family transcriptional regulator, activator of mtrCDE